MKIWILVVELSVQPGDMPSGLTKGFMNVTTWADSAESAADKLRQYVQRFDWQLISIDHSEPVEGKQYGADLADMVEQTEANRDAIILGTLFTYRPE